MRIPLEYHIGQESALRLDMTMQILIAIGDGACAVLSAYDYILATTQIPAHAPTD